MAAGALDLYAADARQAGHNIVSIYLTDGTFMIASPTSIIKGSPHPNAAKAFAEFMISKNAQKIFPEDGGYAARIDVSPPAGSPDLGSLTILVVDYDDIEKQTGEIKNRFTEIFQ